jgi:hypothetical protein
MTEPKFKFIIVPISDGCKCENCFKYPCDVCSIPLANKAHYRIDRENSTKPLCFVCSLLCADTYILQRM